MMKRWTDSPLPRKLEFKNTYFRTGIIGSIWVDVENLVKSEEIIGFESFALNKYLINFIINKDSDPCIGDPIVLIKNFGIVSGHSKLKPDTNLSPVVTYTLAEAKMFMYDSSRIDLYRIDKIESLNMIKYNHMV